MRDTSSEVLSYFEGLADHEYEELLGRLVFYANGLAVRYGWGSPKGLPAGLEVTDLVLGSIEDLLTARRGWDSEDYEMPAVLRGIIRSKFYHLRNLSRTKYEVRTKLSPEELDQILRDPSSTVPTYREVESYQQLAQAIRECASGDTELELIVVCLEDGISKPREIATELDLPVESVNVLLRKLRRRVAAAGIEHPSSETRS